MSILEQFKRYKEVIFKIDVTHLMQKFSWLIYAGVLILFVLTALARIYRWDLMEQISMADNYHIHHRFYPSPDTFLKDNSIHGTSIYFPGVSLLALFFENYLLLSKFLPEVMLLIAVIVTISFLVLLLKLAVIISGEYNPIHVLPYILCYLLILCRNYLGYALEFKPDTIAFLIGFTALIIGFPRKSEKITARQILAAIIIGSAIIFKQQYISFIAGLVFYSMFLGNRVAKIFAAISTTIASLIILTIYWNESAWFWTVTVVADDGFLPIKDLIMQNLDFVRSVLFFVLASITLSGTSRIRVRVKNPFVRSKQVPELFFPVFFIVTFSFVAAYLSSLKNGGNIGNIEFGLILLFPLIYPYLKKIPASVPLLIISFLLVSNPQDVIQSLKKFKEAKELKQFVDNIPTDGIENVLTGSDTYYASRILLNKEIKLDNYWTRSLVTNSNITLGVSEELRFARYDLIIVENWPTNQEAIITSGLYKIAFQNSIGIIALKEHRLE